MIASISNVESLKGGSEKMQSNTHLKKLRE